MSLSKKVKNFIHTQNLLKRGDKVIIGVSGGADSICLADILAKIQFDLGITLIIAHFNHNLRKGSLRDQKFVKKFADKMSIPYIAKQWQRKKGSVLRNSVEQAARDKRLQFFIRCAEQTNAQKIALAHTEDDLAETVLMRILRGSGLMGMRSILPQRKLYNVTFIRPLLESKRSDIENYLMKKKITFINDPTNKQTIFFRNKVRLKLIPELNKNYNSNVKTVLANLSKNVGIDYDYLEKQAQSKYKSMAKISRDQKSLTFRLSKFSKTHRSMQRMLLRHSIKQLHGNTRKLTFQHINEIEDLIENRPKGTVVDLPNKIQVKKGANELKILKK